MFVSYIYFIHFSYIYYVAIEILQRIQNLMLYYYCMYEWVSDWVYDRWHDNFAICFDLFRILKFIRLELERFGCTFLISK